jgi:YbbR domain-containing protein
MKGVLLHNWYLKLLSLALATALWAAVARTPMSEIGLSVSVEYQNIPPETDVIRDTERVDVRLRGPASVLRTITSQDLSLSVDVTGIPMGEEQIVPITPDLVHAPIGVEVVRVIPARARLTVEPIAIESVQVTPSLVGSPASGYEVEGSTVTPQKVQIEGPSSRILRLETISTTDINLTGRQSTFTATVGLDVEDPIVLIHNPGPITVEVRIRPKAK